MISIHKILLYASILLCAYHQTYAMDSIVITYPANASLVTSAPIAITGTSSQANSLVRLFIDSTMVGKAITDGSGNWNSTLTTLINGNHTLTAYLYDATFSIIASSANTFTMQNPNTINITTPSSGENIFLTPSIVSGYSSSASGFVNIYMNNSLVTTATIDPMLYTWQSTYTLNSYGPHSLLAELVIDNIPTATAGVENLLFFPMQARGNSIKVDPIFGNDATGERGGLAFQTINAALNVAASGDTVSLAPGTYITTFTIPAGVTVKGSSRDNVRITNTVSTATDLVTMGENSCLQDVTLTLSSNSHVLLRGIVFPGSTAITANARFIDLTVDNSGASPLGTSNVYGIHSNGTSAVNQIFNAMALARVIVRSAGFGTKRGVLIENTNNFNALACTFAAINTGGGSAIGLETTTAGARTFLKICGMSGTTADISRTAGNITLLMTVLSNSNSNNLNFSTDDQRAKLCWGISGNAPLAGTYFMTIGTDTPSTNTQSVRISGPVIARNLSISSRVAPNSTNTFTLFKNGIATGLTASLTSGNTSAADITNTVSFTTGDLLSMQYVSTTGLFDTAPADLTATIDLF